MIDLDRLPREIVESTRAVMWKWETRKGKTTKPLYQVHDPSRHAKSNNPRTWGSFRAAVDRVLDGKADGAGHVLGAGTAGVDLDDCRNAETGVSLRGRSRSSTDSPAIPKCRLVEPASRFGCASIRGSTSKDSSFTRPDGSKIEMYSLRQVSHCHE